jgi:GTP-binding protein
METESRRGDRGVVIAIDGPAGAGKSTLARALAQELGLAHVNTGLMYRALALRALRRGISPVDERALTEEARSIAFSLGGEPIPELLIDGAPPEPGLRSEDVERIVSHVASHPGVRKLMRDEQRALGRGGGVMEGRDIGTVVFPDADVKVFLSAVPRVRAGRREREQGGGERVGERVARRDSLDARTNPLIPAGDAHVLDTTGLSQEEVLERALDTVRAVIGDTRKISLRSERDRWGRPVIAVVGRRNVGKSTLVNRLAGKRHVIAHETPGVTRDRVEVPVVWTGRTLVLIDTGGYVERASGIEEAVARQAARAMRSADATLLVVDATTGIVEEDLLLAKELRRSQHPVLVVANKVDSDGLVPSAAEFYALGLGEPAAVSALHGRGTAELLDRILDLIPTGAEPVVEDEARFCLVGRPNVGKSSLFNRLVGEERAVVHEEPGTTRDAIDTVIEVDERRIRFIDTAGLRRPLKAQGVEYYGLVRSLRAIDSSHVAALVVDAAQGLVAEDKRVAARVVEAGKGLVAILNKWDLVPGEERSERFIELSGALELFPGTPVVRTAALTGSGVKRVLPALVAVHDAWVRRVPTSEVNRVLQAAVAATPPPRQMGSIKYGTQVGVGPPAFVVFGTREPTPSYRRYLEGSLRRAFGFDGVPVRLSFRARGPRGRRSGARGDKPGG